MTPPVASRVLPLTDHPPRAGYPPVTELARRGPSIPQWGVLSRGVAAWPDVVGVMILAAKVALSAPRLGGQEASVAITWLVVTSFVIIGLVLQATDLPRVNGWACMLVAAATIPGDLNDPHYANSYLTPLGYVLEPLYLPATVALVLRYPRARLTAGERRLLTGLVAASSGARLAVILTPGSVPDNFYRPPGWPTVDLPAWWHDWVFLRVGDTATIVLLLLTGIVLARRVLTTAGVTRQSLAPLAVIGAICSVAASVDQAIWVLNLSSLHWVPAALVRDLSAAAIPVAILADLLRRRAATAAVSEQVLVASSSGDTGQLQSALRKVLVDPTVEVCVANQEGTWVDAAGRRTRAPSGSPGNGRRTEVVSLADGTPLVVVSCDRHAVGDEGLLMTALTAVRVGAENLRLHADLLARMAELQESRARIVDAAMLERRRVERDLHDGAQQQFLAVAATLARADFVADGQVRDVVTDAQGRLTAALRELRQLARGIHPAALSQGGLPAALPTLCVGIPQRVDLHVDADLGQRRPSPGQETAIYFFVAEALTNAVRHSGADRLGIDVRRDDHSLRAVVSDNGAGRARLVPGGGLAGLTDRIEALGGQLSLHCDPCPDHPDGRGSTLTVSLPTHRVVP